MFGYKLIPIQKNLKPQESTITKQLLADEVGENLLLILFGGTVTAGRERKSNLRESRTLEKREREKV